MEVQRMRMSSRASPLAKRTTPLRQRMPTLQPRQASGVDAADDTFGQATSSKVQPVQVSGGTMTQQPPMEAISTDPVDSLETHMCDGKLEKSLQDYIYYDTNSARRSATGNTTELFLAESTGYSAAPLAIESLGFPKSTTPKSKPGTECHKLSVGTLRRSSRTHAIIPGGRLLTTTLSSGGKNAKENLQLTR
ncbi:hypothetical protein MTO96_027351 [Rhipicephalus appendiculatus]